MRYEIDKLCRLDEPPPPSLSRKTSESSSIFEDLPMCDDHHLCKDYFCYDCVYEVCVECIKQQHNEHYLYPGLSCKELFEETERARNMVRDNIMTIEKQINTLHYKKMIAAGNIKAFFHKFRELVDTKEVELLNDVGYIAECRARILDQKLKENQSAMNGNQQLMDTIQEFLRMGNIEGAIHECRFAKKHLEVLRSLQRNAQQPDEDIVFIPPDDPCSVGLKELGTITCPSYVASVTCNNMRNIGNGTTSSATMNGTSTRTNGISAVGSQLTTTNGSSSLSTSTSITTNGHSAGSATSGGNPIFDNGPTFHPFQPFGPPQPRSPLFSSSQQTISQQQSQTNTMFPTTSTTITTNSNAVAAAAAMAAIDCNLPQTTNLNVLPFIGKPLRKSEPVPNCISPLNTMSSDMNMFPVSFHTRRNYARIKKPVTVFGKEGSGDYDLCRPWGVCCDNNGHIIIADRSNNRIQIFRSDGSHVRKFGQQGTEEGEFNRPAGVAIDYYGRIVVTDKDNHRVQVFTMEGKFVFAFGERGQSNGKFHYPWDVDVNSAGLIAISDTRNHRIQLFTGNGMFLKKFGFESMSNMWKFFDSPRGLCFTPDNTIMVTDFNNHRLYEIDIEKTPKLLNADNYKRCELFRPQGLAMDAEGNVLVADCRNNRIQVFSRAGELIGSFGVAGKELGQFDRPSGIALTPDGKIVVVDFGNHRIQIF